MNLPKINTNLLVKDFADEVLVYDLHTNKSYCLNSTARIVFNACDGEKTFADLNLPDEMIYLTLDELKKQNLIQDDYVSHFAGMNRREVIRKVGLASMVALQVISALVAPSPSHAASSNCRMNICIPAGQNACAGCAGRTVTQARYPAGSGCTGPQESPLTGVCPPTLTSSFDRVTIAVT